MRTHSQNSVQGPSRRSMRLTTFMLGVGCSRPVCGSNLRAVGEKQQAEIGQIAQDAYEVALDRIQKQQTPNYQDLNDHHCNFDAVRCVLQSASPAHRGRRWRGQGTILNSCGRLYTKLMIWGMKNMSSVSEKWPRMPATASAMPAK